MTVTRTADLAFVDVRKRLDFRSISIGRWATSAERERSAGKCYVALEDLMHALRCPEQVISLRGSLSFQFGIGGQLGVAAHYDPSQRCFSLAKNAGPGSIAHEWFHALDHYLADKVHTDAPANMFASMAWLNNATPVKHLLNEKLYQCFKLILLSPDTQQVSELVAASRRVDKKLQRQYYSKPEELCARAFEAFIDDSAAANPFLVTDTVNCEGAKLGLYPQALQRLSVNSALDSYFSLLGHALRQQST